MRIGFDATAVVAGNTGVARYTSRLLAELHRREEVEVAAFAIGRGQPAPAGVRHTRLPLRVAHAMWPLLRWPTAESLVGGVDVLHALDMVPAPTRSPVVLTVHDVLPARLPHLYSPRTRRISAQNLAAATRAAVILADCQATAVEISEATGRPADDVVVAPPGPLLTAGVTLAPPVAPAYVLAVGAVTPRKGLATLASALARVPHAPPLVIAGPDGWRADEVRAAVRSALGERATFLGWVDDAVLASLYAGATVFAFPSVAEGFGIPVLESLARGTPVVASDIAPVREVAGDAAVLVPPGDEEALAHSLREILQDEDRRRAMKADGLAAAAQYSWPGTADAVLSAYRRAVEC